MREKLLQMLTEKEGAFVSGEKISQHLGCSRTAVWKHVEELRKAGYELEAVTRRGYRLTKKPNAITPFEVRAKLHTQRLGQNIYYEESVRSTQEMAHRLAQEQAAEGTIVIADEQVGGKGRLGRVWHSPMGTSISMSLILRPTIPPQQAPQLTLLTAVAVVKGIQRATDLECEIKWPNDILLNGKKIVGILTEMQCDPDRVHAVIVGIGINVNHRAEQFPAELRDIATSLSLEKGSDVSRAEVIRCILEELEQLYDEYLHSGFALVKRLWESLAVSIGQRITARTVNQVLVGLAKGITDEGVLQLEDDEGTIHLIYSADIEINTTKS